MLASEIAFKLGYELVGDDCDVTGVTWHNTATLNDIAIIRDGKDLQTTRAMVVLSAPIVLQTEKTLLITYENIECSMVKVCNLLINNRNLPDYSIPTNYKVTAWGYYIGERCDISESAIIQPGVKIGDDVIVGNGCVIEPDTFIGSGTVLGDNVYIGPGSKIGTSSFYHYYENGQINNFIGCGIVKIGRGSIVGSNTVIQRGTISDTCIGSNNMIGDFVDVGHDVKIGNSCKIVSQTGIAGGAAIKNNVTIYGQVGISNNVVIGNNVVVKARTIVTRTVDDNQIIYGPFGRNYSEEMKLMAMVRNFFNRKEK